MFSLGENWSEFFHAGVGAVEESGKALLEEIALCSLAGGNRRACYH